MPDTIRDADRILSDRWTEVDRAGLPTLDDPESIALFNTQNGRYYYLIARAGESGWSLWRIERDKADERFRRPEDIEFVGLRPTSGECAVLAVIVMEEQP